MSLSVVSKPKDCNHQDLELWGADSKMNSDQEVVRIRKENSEFRFSVNYNTPSDLFRPNSADWEEAIARQKQPLASVFKDELSEQQLREARYLPEDSKGVVFSVRVGCVDELVVPEGATTVPIEIHEDPNDGVHGEYHGGLQGMYKQAFSNTSVYRSVREELNRLCSLYPNAI